MPENAPQTSARPAPNLGELLELSLGALLRPQTSFQDARTRQAPSFGSVAGFALANAGLAIAVNFARSAVADPKFLSLFPPALIFAVGVAALVAYASLPFLFAGLLWSISRLLGGQGGSDGFLWAASALSLLAPLQALSHWLPAAWILPTLAGGWVAAGALSALFEVNLWPARAACVVLTAVILSLQAAVRLLAERAHQAYAAAQATAAVAQFSQTLSAPSPAPSEGQNSSSSLDLLRAPSDMGAPSPLPPNAPDMNQQAASLNQSAVGMLDAAAPLLNNPAFTRNLTPSQKADMAELQALMKGMRAQMLSGQRLSNEEHAQRMARLQQLTMRLMSSGIGQTGARAGEKHEH